MGTDQWTESPLERKRGKEKWARAARRLKYLAFVVAGLTALWLAIAPSYFEVALYDSRYEAILIVSAVVLWVAGVVIEATNRLW